MLKLVDPQLQRYATEREWEILNADVSVTSRHLRRVKAAVTQKAALAGYSPDHDMTHETPPGFNVKGTSTLYDSDGEVKSQWVKTAQDKEQQEIAFRAAIEGFTDDLPRAEITKGPTTASSDLMACYPVGDHHVGMLSWDKETGKDYDLQIAENLLMGATNHLIQMAPACETATIVFLGDFMHYDSFTPETPTSRNKLDADSRFPRMVRYAVRSMRYMIQRALTQHQQVNVIVEIGNHDLSSSIFLMECLSNVYEHEPRVSIDTSPMHYHYFTHGKVLVGVHHGHGAKMAQLPLIMAADRAADWGTSTFRYWWTGHIHHDSAKDFHGTRVESFRILAPNDAWAAEKGYRSMQDMKGIILHKEFGEVSRHTVNPEMLK
jgi:hypothetical protein